MPDPGASFQNGDLGTLTGQVRQCEICRLVAANNGGRQSRQWDLGRQLQVAGAQVDTTGTPRCLFFCLPY